MQSEWKGVKRSKSPGEHPNANGQNERNVAEWLSLDIQTQMLIGC